MLSCNCLNVIIVPEIDDFQKVTSESLQLSDTEKKDTFFNQEIQQIRKLNKVITKISALVMTRQVGSRWTVSHCINCNVHTHAINHDHGTARVLVSNKLLGREAIAEIKASEEYSPVFDIKIMQLERSHTPSATVSITVIESLRQRVHEFINKETSMVEDRIKRFTEDQYKALEDYREKILEQHNLLKLRILGHKLSISPDSEMSTNMETTLYQNNLKSPVRIVPDVSRINSFLVEKSTTNRTSPNEADSDPLANPSMQTYEHWSPDAEVLFPLEDMQDETTLGQSDFEESDPEDLSKEDGGEPILQQRPRQAPTQLAKSLPVNIPVFLSSLQNHIGEDNDDELPEDSMDIAASIKALAKSIQGSTVFGELPRPRFSSQI